MLVLLPRSDDSDDEITDHEVSKIIIVTQTPPCYKKHPGGDRTGYHVSRSKITNNLAKIINDGLYYYEMDLWMDDEIPIPKVTKNILIDCRGHYFPLRLSLQATIL